MLAWWLEEPYAVFVGGYQLGETIGKGASLSPNRNAEELTRPARSHTDGWGLDRACTRCQGRTQSSVSASTSSHNKGCAPLPFTPPDTRPFVPPLTRP